MNRRRFLEVSMAGLAGGILAACAPETQPAPAGPTAGPSASRAASDIVASPQLAPTETPFPARPGSAVGAGVGRETPLGAAPPGTILRNEDVPGFYVRYYRPFSAPDPATWQLEVGGLVDAPVVLTLEQILRDLDHREQNTRMKCVECWSFRAVWGGFNYAALAELVKPQPSATHVRFDCADSYWEVLPISELQREGALFVTHMNGMLLPAKYGSPLRMILPWLYGYKGAKAITRLTFQATGGAGYWSTVAPYSVEGNIQAGTDYPLDLDERRSIQGGEITEY